jgi:hypothetical protein
MKLARKVIDRYDALLLIIATLWFAIGFYNLDAKSVSFDEGWSIYPRFITSSCTAGCTL